MASFHHILTSHTSIVQWPRPVVIFRAIPICPTAEARPHETVGHPYRQAMSTGNAPSDDVTNQNKTDATAMSHVPSLHHRRLSHRVRPQHHVRTVAPGPQLMRRRLISSAPWPDATASHERPKGVAAKVRKQIVVRASQSGTFGSASPISAPAPETVGGRQIACNQRLRTRRIGPVRSGGPAGIVSGNRENMSGLQTSLGHIGRRQDKPGRVLLSSRLCRPGSAQSRAVSDTPCQRRISRSSATVAHRRQRFGSAPRTHRAAARRRCRFRQTRP